ncbi:MAG: hypothetical protein Ct9H300mP31_15890 [Acidimicrobiaceae bacterium]|nr:MAG: hypothetical protein Ct9H300mP31_15890 [Acidimicrobiaceae bacterium]
MRPFPKSATVSFGQALFPGDMERAEEAARPVTPCWLRSTLGSTQWPPWFPLAVRHGAASW